MTDGFSIFVGFVLTVIGLGLLAMVAGLTSGAMKDQAIKDGFFQRNDQFYSVQPAVMRPTSRNP